VTHQVRAAWNINLIAEMLVKLTTLTEWHWPNRVASGSSSRPRSTNTRRDGDSPPSGENKMAEGYFIWVKDIKKQTSCQLT
jgi:hypothetical protein